MINYFLIFIFFLINSLIIYGDIKYKKIKNLYIVMLLLLLPFFYHYFNFSYDGLFFIVYSILFSIMGGLFYYGIIPGGDYKYILVLSLFVGSSIPYFIGNLSFIILTIFIFSYLFFSVLKITKFKTKEINLNSINKIYLKKKNDNVNLLLSIINIFLFIKILIFILTYYGLIQYFGNYFSFFILFGIILFKYTINKLILDLNIKALSNLHNAGNYFLILFATYIVLIINNLILFKVTDIFIFLVFFISIMLIIKSILFSIKKNDEKFIDINILKPGCIVDRNFLHKIFGQHKTITDFLTKKKIIRGRGFFKNFTNPVDNSTVKTIKRIYSQVNKKNLLDDNKFSQINKVKTLDVFSFGPYIFLAFCLLFFINISIYNLIIDFLHINY